MLGTDVVVQKPIGFLGSEPQYAFGFRAERNLDRRRHLVAKDRATFDLLTNVLQ
jgi:hypothetical protein